MKYPMHIMTQGFSSLQWVQNIQLSTKALQVVLLLGHHVHRETLDAADHSNHANSNINNDIICCFELRFLI